MSNTKKANKLGAMLVRYACPICLKEVEDLTEIAIKKRFVSEEYAERMHMEGITKFAGIASKPCKECQKLIDEKNAFFIVGIDEEKSDDMHNPYRSGHIVGISKDSEFYKHLEDKYKKSFMLYMDHRAMRQFGMIE